MQPPGWILVDSSIATGLDTAIDKGANIFDPPGGDARPEFHGLWESTGFDPAHHVDLLTGIGPSGPRIDLSLRRPLFGSSVVKFGSVVEGAG